MKKWLIILALLLLPFNGFAAEPADSVTIVRSMINETTASFWSDVQLQEWIDQGVIDVLTRGLFLQNYDDIALSTGIYAYSTTTEDSVSVANILKVFGAIYLSPDNEYIGLKKILPSQISDLPHMLSGPPKYYCLFDEVIIILPVPSAAENGKEVKLFYAMRTTAASQALRIADVPAIYKSLIYHYAAYMAFNKEHRTAEAQSQYQIYLEKLKYLKADLYNTPSEVPTK